MTVRRLRELLFDVEDQNAQVVVVTPDCIKDGHVKRTHEVGARRAPAPYNKLVLGHPDDPAGYVSILTKN